MQNKNTICLKPHEINSERKYKLFTLWPVLEFLRFDHNHVTCVFLVTLYV